MSGKFTETKKFEKKHENLTRIRKNSPTSIGGEMKRWEAESPKGRLDPDPAAS